MSIELYLDQRAGTPTGSGNGRYFMFSEYIRAPRGSVLTLQLQSVTIPLTHWVINSSNDTLVLQYSVDDTSVTIRLPNGNKTIDSVVAVINAGMGVGTQWGWGVEYDFDTNQLLFKNTSTSLYPSVTIGEGTTCTELLGFEVGDTSNGQEMRSRGIDLSGDACFYINSDQRTTNIRPFGGGDVSVVGRIPITRGTNDVERWTNYNGFTNTLSVDFLSGLYIEILDDRCDKQVEFHGGYWTVSLVFGNVEEANPRLLYTASSVPLSAESEPQQPQPAASAENLTVKETPKPIG
jgi:hypothetical protein